MWFSIPVLTTRQEEKVAIPKWADAEWDKDDVVDCRRDLKKQLGRVSFAPVTLPDIFSRQSSPTGQKQNKSKMCPKDTGLNSKCNVYVRKCTILSPNERERDRVTHLLLNASANCSIDSINSRVSLFSSSYGCSIHSNQLLKSKIKNENVRIIPLTWWMRDPAATSNSVDCKAGYRSRITRKIRNTSPSRS